MAELSTLTPTPPALGEPHAAPSIPPPSAVLPAPNSPAAESTKEAPVPKSSLSSDKLLTGNAPAAQLGGSLMAPQTQGPPLCPPKITAETALLSLVQETAPQSVDTTGKVAETGVAIDDMKREMMTSDLLNATPDTPAQSSEPSAQSQASPSPDLNPGPNLYPSVQVTLNPNPVADDAQIPASQPQTTAGSHPTPASTSATETAAEMVEVEKPQPLQQAQTPQTLPPPVPPKPDTPSEARKAETPSTPTRADPPSPLLPVIEEPASAPSPPNPRPRPAPDTLSYLESASLMSGTLESLSGLGDDGSSLGSDSEINGLTIRRTDKYGFLGGNQYSECR